MKRIMFNLLPNGKSKCVTFSYDDGRIYDVRLAEIFDKYGAKCTFNLNAFNVGANERYIDADTVKKFAEKHEIACHAYYHPFLERLPVGALASEIYEDKKGLESIVKEPIIGMAYPFGTYDNGVVSALKAMDIKYCRTVKSTNGFGIPEDFLTWHPTCHHRDSEQLAENFIKLNRSDRFYLFYIWGHSYEFNDNDNWEVIENTLETLSKDDSIWYATNGEIYDYITAIKSLRVSIDRTSVYNPTNISVFATIDGEAVEFKPGLTRI